MNFTKLQDSFTSLKQGNTVLIAANGALVAMLSVSLFINMQKDTIVMNNMNDSCEVMTISQSSMHENGHKRIGFLLATLLGNITPENNEIISDAVMPYIAPDIYQDVKDQLALQLRELKKDEITMSFTPEMFLLENGTAFITGKGQMSGPTGKPKKYVRTYEFEIEVVNYTPLVRYVDVYEGGPRDSEWQRKQKKAEERQK
ncbi:TraE/TraK family type IV conjugative transfer system protein [Vibrio fluvialis]|uniref:TraE/TraK family type IV conjugative transfer system protein n=1 Tax=Vibrio fluvialis TaxID=676 RepID=UPI0025742225|nr:TraE/TraK family type IV conjugative transfer system protein [Vibrio fluvialis]BEI26516.1 hypothetical protein KKIDH5335_48480 [Vibrio fluvialis]